MNHTLSVFSLEELALAFSLLDADEQTEHLLQSFYGNMSGGQKRLLFVAARHSLISKGFILPVNDPADKDVLMPDIEQMLRHLIQSKHKLLGIMENEDEETLMVHVSQGKHIYHLSKKNAVHFLGWTSPVDWIDRFTAFFRLSSAGSEILVRHDRSTLLSPVLWNKLTDEDWDQSTDILTWDIPSSQKDLLIHWYRDYLANDRLLHRISYIVQDNSGPPQAADVLYILPDQAGVWTVHQQPHESNTEQRISIALLTLEEWKQQLVRFTAQLTESNPS
ncbi:hypothetical protein OIN60_20010 [Paenibacillus sp. P96]|uniref:Uncharacterized protein n=1 Tax=Paenibacillus zeirhizosphaerae TaxID=2987519 RepID=A0ABT9FWC0_9BACL|nr:hypothetical protein [Paenibacillus sp. P96]MDP4099014.1 hypothetical protein [Paenibacillus sp. P96]